MKVLIIGAAGMVGNKLARHLAATGSLAGVQVSSLTLADAVMPQAPTGAPTAVSVVKLDIAQRAAVDKVIADEPDVIFHLAAIVSGEAEQNFDKGYAINLDGTRFLLEAIRARGAHYVPKVIFTSSIAVFGPPFPDAIDDDFRLTPTTSYGTQKAIDELLLADFTRKGFVDGIGLRLPTICVRPGKPNLAASGFFSSIIREPLAGLPAVLPVSVDVRHWHASPRAALGFLLHAASLPKGALGSRPNLTLPGLSVTVGEQLEALRGVAGASALSLVRMEPDATIAKIVAGWPQNFTPTRALALGFRAENTFAEIIQAHIEDEMSGKVV